MIVFNSYLKIVKKFIPIIIMYLVIFTFFAVAATSSNSEQSSFVATKPKVALINNDKDSKLVLAFEEYLNKIAKLKKIEGTDDSIKDALFFRKIDYILIVPENFTKDFMAGKNPEIETMKIPDSYSSKYTEMLLNKFLNIANLYTNTDMSEEEIIANLKDDMAKEIEVVLNDKDVKDFNQANYFYNFCNYIILGLGTLTVGMLINVFNDTNIKRKNIVSKMSYKKINAILFAGNFIVMTAMWLACVGISFIFYKDSMLTMNGALLILNSFVFSVTALAISFLIGNLIKNKEATNAIANVLALGTSFICGAFVPQEFLGDFVTNLSKVLPSYWFITNNNMIVKLNDFTNLQPIFKNMMIVLLFGVACFIITNVVSRMKLKKS